MIKQQMYGRAGFTFLRHRILLKLTPRTIAAESEPAPFNYSR